MENIDNFEVFINGIDCFFNNLEIYANKALPIFIIIGILYGIYAASSYVSRIKDKKTSLFNFCPRLSTYLKELKHKLQATHDRNILLCKFHTDSLINKNNIIIPNAEEINSFLNFIKNFMEFIKTTDNQIPLSSKFYETYKILIDKLLTYLDLGKVTPYGDYEPYEGKKIIENEKKEINKIIDTLLKIIENEQERAYNNIFQKLKNMLKSWTC
jgi:hypothetical protein